MWRIVADVCALLALISIAAQLRAMRLAAAQSEHATDVRHQAWMAQLEALGYALGLATRAEPSPHPDRVTPLDTGPIAPPPGPFPPPPRVPSLPASAPPVALALSLPAPPYDADAAAEEEDVDPTTAFCRATTPIEN